MDYRDLVNIDELQKRETFNMDRGEISYFCKDCNKIVEVETKEGKKIKFICKTCNGENIAIGSHEGLIQNYKKRGF